MNTYKLRGLSGTFIVFVVMILFGSYFVRRLTFSAEQNIAWDKQAERTIAETSLNDKTQQSRDSDMKQETIDKHSQKQIKVWTHLPKDTQMSELQAAAIKRATKSTGNLLVWGLGNDSPFWHDITEGKVIFIEPAGVWYDKITRKYPFLEVVTVNYTTSLDKSFAKYINNSAIWSDLDIRSQFPDVVVHTPWNVIIVDAPPGYYSTAPGRFQSIYTSLLLARNGTHIFVDDYDRKVERQFSNKMLGTPVEVIKRPTIRNSLANEQAHFIWIKN